EIHNLLNFGPLAPDDPVILVQVHDRWHYLQHLLESLSRAQGIEKALLIISHDYYDSHVDLLPTTISFCKVMQIFFPYSTQLFPNQFPGRDPMDCARDIGKERAFQVKCLNAKYSDSYGHYRESEFTQIKHHWWWKINVVMDTLNVTRSHQGPVLLLEEDYYVAPDYLSAARQLLDNKQ
ncbi:beta-1,2-N-acetylglucosaminyltransferase II, putative, partial [Ixodes scapularis]